MAQRLSTECPACRAPGFGHVHVEHGLPCTFCGSATQAIAADIHGCGRCTHQIRTPRNHALAAPEWCDDKPALTYRDGAVLSAIVVW
ncbi:DUF6671 family protein [Cryobacterium sp. TMT2-18-3]|uniref:DUF6671 family protein n=1 Tax=unclassified Cryobacterium TaxID=2649013 RepID=UPI003519E4C9